MKGVFIIYALISARNMQEFESFTTEYGPPSCHIKEGDLREALNQAARLQLEFLVLDIDFSRVSAAELHQYRLQRPTTRIILLAPEREPGDLLISKLVGLGIYDIVSGSGLLGDELRQTIQYPANYTQAARWLQFNHDWVIQSKKNGYDPEKKDMEREVIVQQRPLGLTTIAVAGAGSGTGTSHLCLMLASYLGQQNTKVAIAEWPTGNSTSEKSQYLGLVGLGAICQPSCLNGVTLQIASMDGFDIFLDARSFRSIDYVFPWAAHNSYDYLILDMGELAAEKVKEMDRAALAILVTHASPYRFGRFSPIASRDSEICAPNISKWKIALNLAGEKEIQYFQQAFAQSIGKTYAIPYLKNPMDQADLIEDILQPVLPTGQTFHKKSFWNYFKFERRGFN